MERITLPQLEDAINYWRNRVPAHPDDHRLCSEAAALAVPYALMIIGHRRDISRDELTPAARLAYQTWQSAAS